MRPHEPALLPVFRVAAGPRPKQSPTLSCCGLRLLRCHRRWVAWSTALRWNSSLVAVSASSCRTGRWLWTGRLPRSLMTRACWRRHRPRSAGSPFVNHRHGEFQASAGVEAGRPWQPRRGPPSVQLVSVSVIFAHLACLRLYRERHRRR